jgi:hypothetical protein
MERKTSPVVVGFKQWKVSLSLLQNKDLLQILEREYSS